MDVVPILVFLTCPVTVDTLLVFPNVSKDTLTLGFNFLFIFKVVVEEEDVVVVVVDEKGEAEVELEVEVEVDSLELFFFNVFVGERSVPAKIASNLANASSFLARSFRVLPANFGSKNGISTFLGVVVSNPNVIGGGDMDLDDNEYKEKEDSSLSESSFKLRPLRSLKTFCFVFVFSAEFVLDDVEDPNKERLEKERLDLSADCDCPPLDVCFNLNELFL
tara:strand:+ start:949 stop:1608 length:660 start_codon:yes stop_codon:yes gene_type:complete